MDESSQEEDEEPSSSSSFSTPVDWQRANNQNLDDELEKFRRNWRTELKNGNENVADSATNIEEKEKENVCTSSSAKFYRLAMLCEQKGRVREAVELYRRAFKLNPEIEKQFVVRSALKDGNSEADSTKVKSIDSEDENNNDYSTSNSSDSVLKNLLNLQSKITPEKTQKNRHIGALPAELLILILKWVVSAHLDVRQLEQLSMVCRGFYVLCRRDAIWRSICQRCWPTVNLTLVDSTDTKNKYRKLYVEKPRLLYTGLYISKISYIRRGEDNSFQDRAFSQQWHLVTYYRYLRFFEDGHVIMVTTPDEPSSVVPRLKNRRKIWQNNVLSPKALSGNFVLEMGDDFAGHMTCFFSRWKNESNCNDSKRKPYENINAGQCFVIELRICPPKKRTCVLEWRNYRIKTTYSSEGQKTERDEDVNILQINERHFAPFYFSRVKSYANYSEICL